MWAFAQAAARRTSVVRWVWIALETALDGRYWYRGGPSWINEPPTSRTDSNTAITARLRTRPRARTNAKTSPTRGAKPMRENSKIRSGMNNPPVTESGVDASSGTKATRNKTSRTPAAGRAGPDNRIG